MKLSKEEAIQILLNSKYLELYESDILISGDEYDEIISNIRDIFRAKGIWFSIKNNGTISLKQINTINICDIYPRQYNYVKGADDMVVTTNKFDIEINDLIISNRKNKLNKLK